MHHAKFLLTLVWVAAVAGAGACTSSPSGDHTADCTDPSTFYPDGDGDGYGDDSAMMMACAQPTGYIAMGGDCNDHDAAVHPGADEVCDGIDNDCNGKVDEADPGLDAASTTTYFHDGDGDGYGDPSSVEQACVQPAEYVANATDCNDQDAAVHPGADEVCDGIDNDCNGLVDEADPGLDTSTEHAYYADHDADSYGAGSAVLACSPPTGYVALAGDCNDSNPATHPGAIEICDGADNDCDGGIDGTPQHPNQCATLVGTYSGTYSHQATESVGTIIVNQMTCSSTGSASLALGRSPALQGTFNCVYSGGLEAFDQTQTMKLSAEVALDGTVTGTIDHVYNALDGIEDGYPIAGTLTSAALTLSGTGSVLINQMDAVPWDVTFSVAAER